MLGLGLHVVRSVVRAMWGGSQQKSKLVVTKPIFLTITFNRPTCIQCIYCMNAGRLSSLCIHVQMRHCMGMPACLCVNVCISLICTCHPGFLVDLFLSSYDSSHQDITKEHISSAPISLPPSLSSSSSSPQPSPPIFISTTGAQGGSPLSLSGYLYLSISLCLCPHISSRISCCSISVSVFTLSEPLS